MGILNVVICLLLNSIYFVVAFDSRYFDDGVLYRISMHKNHLLGNLLESADHRPELVPIKSSDDESYFCLIPNIATEKRSKISEYVGPSPQELIGLLYKENFCSLRIDSYWSYEICHQRAIRQFHEAKDTKTKIEYVLGKYREDANAKLVADYDQLNPPRKDIEGKLQPYYPVVYTYGSHCDLSGTYRKATVLYVCAQDSIRSVLSIDEIKTCEYEIVIAIKELCSHPSFKTNKAPENEIQCFSTDPNIVNPIPKALIKFQTEVKSRPMLPVKSNEGPLTQRIPTTQTIANEVYNLFKSQQKRNEEQEHPRNLAASETSSNDENTKMLEAFWSGRACLYGGTGYWRIEFCFGKSISQFHEENGRTLRVHLGYFDEQLHKEWLKETNVVARKLELGNVEKISNMYTRGDICTETKRLRKCEVRMSCLKESEVEDPNTINMFLTEPETCSYILMVESPLFCERLQKADEFGVLPRSTDNPKVADDGLYVAEIDDDDEDETLNFKP
ncbi:hypothetical protein M3Y96_00055000 [Aphelenchoides besseyi]|nr:hypothetical protein M3Y96_00055000 [Aphelenchoides besseyi]